MKQALLFDHGKDPYDQIQCAGVYFEMCHLKPGLEAIKIGECLRGWVKMNFYRRPLTSIRQLVAFCPSSKPLPIESKLLSLFEYQRVKVVPSQYENDLSVELFRPEPVLQWLNDNRFVGVNGDPAIIDERDMLAVLT